MRRRSTTARRPLPSARPDVNGLGTTRTILAAATLLLAVAVPLSAWTADTAPDYYQACDSWQASMLASRAAFLPSDEDRNEAATRLWDRVEQEWPVQWDWAVQDVPAAFPRWFTKPHDTFTEQRMLRRVIDELGQDGEEFHAEFEQLRAGKAGPDDGRWLELYVRACEARRKTRLEGLIETRPRIVFTKHFNLGGSHYAYTEGQSDAQRERHFEPGASLCLLEMDGLFGTVHTLLEDANGVIRDPDVSCDGKRILFAWKKSLNEDDYHLYEMDAESKAIRQLTSGLGFADYEGAYLPNGDILFTSTRCVQTVDCWWTEVSTFYTCDKDGRFMRRLGFDQVHTNYPAVLPDGRVIYTRWEYSDRGQVFVQSLFQMNYDGTAQQAFYGNNSWFPTTILHARGIPGTQQVVAVASGHHTRQTGKLILIDASQGREENAGVRLIAPERETESARIDQYGQVGRLFQYPYPLSRTEFITGFDAYGYTREPVRFKICFVTADGRREVLAADPAISCSQPVPLAPRPVPRLRPSTVDYRQDTGTYLVQDIYAGPGLEGVPRGAIKRLRVIAIEYRVAGIGDNRNNGPAGGALISTPPSIDNGAWDVKTVLGDAKVYEDGSACFTVPARTPVYFQAIDENGHAVQTMRSWSTLQPGESFACVGCHESPNNAPPRTLETAMAAAAGPQTLEPFYGPPRGFSFPNEIQPILDRHCVQCHADRSLPPPGTEKPSGKALPTLAFSLLGDTTVDSQAKRKWSDSYLALTQRGKQNGNVNWVNAQSAPPMLPPYHAGAAKSGLVSMLEDGHGDVELSQEEKDKIACWIDLLVPFCGDYAEAHAWSLDEIRMYDHFLDKRTRMEQLERHNIAELLEDPGLLESGQAR